MYANFLKYFVQTSSFFWFVF